MQDIGLFVFRCGICFVVISYVTQVDINRTTVLMFLCFVDVLVIRYSSIYVSKFMCITQFCVFFLRHTREDTGIVLT